MKEAQVQSLVRELRSHMLPAWPKHKMTTIKLNIKSTIPYKRLIGDMEQLWTRWGQAWLTDQERLSSNSGATASHCWASLLPSSVSQCDANKITPCLIYRHTQRPALKGTSSSHFCTYALKLNSDMDGNSKETQTAKPHPLLIMFLSLIIFLLYSLVTQDPDNGHYRGNRNPRLDAPQWTLLLAPPKGPPEILKVIIGYFSWLLPPTDFAFPLLFELQ